MEQEKPVSASNTNLKVIGFSGVINQLMPYNINQGDPMCWHLLILSSRLNMSTSMLSFALLVENLVSRLVVTILPEEEYLEPTRVTRSVGIQHPKIIKQEPALTCS
jgi:hypothetical protein